MEIDLTKQDIKDLTEGIKKRPEHKFKDLPKLSNDEKLIELIIEGEGCIDFKSASKRFEKTSSEINKIIQELGYY